MADRDRHCRLCGRWRHYRRATGDTIQRVRYIGMHTPERGEPCANDAPAANAALVDERTVALVADGWAEAARYPPDTTFAAWFDLLETQVRAANLGCYLTGIFGAAPAVPMEMTPLPPTPIVPSVPTATPEWNCIGNRYNCGHFKTCEELMSYWNACPGDPSQLDGKRDGKPRESLCGR